MLSTKEGDSFAFIDPVAFDIFGLLATGNEPVGPQPQDKKKKCVGKARVLKGNPATVGAPLGRGAFNNPPNAVPVQAGSAAVIPAQFGGLTTSQLKPFAGAGQITGVIGGGLASFNGVTDVIGSTEVKNVRGVLQARYPNLFILELVTGPDLGIQPITLTIPAGLPCPMGTHPGN